VYTKDELDSFYVQFSNEFRNKTDDRRFTVLARDDLEKLINMEARFQLSDYSSKEKTAEMQRVLNAQQILYCLILKVGNEIHITVSRRSFPELSVLRGGKTISVTNKNQLFGKIPELVQAMVSEIAGGGTPAQTPILANFVYVEGGTFLMGSPLNERGRADDELQHRVTVSSFYMSKYPVTFKEYQEIMGKHPFHDNIEGNTPIHSVSWYDAIEFCNKRSQKDGLIPAYKINKERSDVNNKSSDDRVRWLVTWERDANGYRLPTEAEWEYACRAGTTTPYNTGDFMYYNYLGDEHVIEPVGSYPPNPLGLYDTHGRVWEWCWDWYGGYFPASQSNPTGSTEGTGRVLRGGGYERSACRFGFNPSDTGVALAVFGFRLVRNAN